MLLWLMLAGPVAAGDESAVKAAFIEKLTRFIEWPEGSAARPGESFQLCLIGTDTLDGALDQLAEVVSVKGRALRIRYLDAVEDVAGCNALFISRSMATELDSVVLGTRPHPILTIGDTEGYAAQGVMINFFLESGRLRFEINLGAARAAGFRFGSRVLKLARIVDGEV